MNHWQSCLKLLQQQLGDQQYQTYIAPLQAEESPTGIRLLAPNQYVSQQLQSDYLSVIQTTLEQLGLQHLQLEIVVGSLSAVVEPRQQQTQKTVFDSKLSHSYTFSSHVEGKSNKVARAASEQVASNPGTAYNPLFIYGGTGLGKTHLMQAAGNRILELKPEAQVLYARSENFVSDMVSAIHHNTMTDFKKRYRNLNALLIDDIQFFSNKSGFQEEFFHTFNALLENNSQVIITCDRFYKDVEGIEERLISRFGSGLTVVVDPPELETRVAILLSKASGAGIVLPDEVAFFVARRVRSNVRELEGALNRIIANARFTGEPIDLELAHFALRDLLGFQERQISVNNIQKKVAEYFGVRVSDLLSKRRSRNVTRPRQVAMALSKELTNDSLPSIGDAFGGRDHTTVMHACRKIESLRAESEQMNADYTTLLRTLGN